MLESLNLPSHVTPHYLVTVEGTLWDKDANGNKVAKGYECKIPVPLKATVQVPVESFDEQKMTYVTRLESREVSINDYGIRSYIKRSKRVQDKLAKLHDEQGHKKFINIVQIREIHITNVIASHPGIPLPLDPSTLSMTQLKTLVKTMGWKIDLAFFNTLQLLREAIVNYKEDPKGYETYELRMKRVKGRQSAFTAIGDDLDAYYEALANGTEQEGAQEAGEGFGGTSESQQVNANKNVSIEQYYDEQI